MHKLPSLPRKKKLTKVDVVVIRTTRAGNLGISRPCVHCLEMMGKLLPEKGYRACDIYYSGFHGEVIKVSYSKLLEDRDNAHYSRYYKDRNYRKKYLDTI